MLDRSFCSTAERFAVAVGIFPGGSGGNGALAPAPQMPNWTTKRTMQLDRSRRIAMTLDDVALHPRMEQPDSNASLRFLPSTGLSHSARTGIRNALNNNDAMRPLSGYSSWTIDRPAGRVCQLADPPLR